MENNNIILPEYGRNIQKLINLILKINNKEKKKKICICVLLLIKKINNILRIIKNNDIIFLDMFLISKKKLNINSNIKYKYDNIKKSEKKEKKKKIEFYKQNNFLIFYKFYGINIQKVIKKKEFKKDKKLKIRIINFMRYHYKKKNKGQNISTKIINKHIEIILNSKYNF